MSVLSKLRSVADSTTRLVVEVPILENGATNDINGFLSVQHMTHFSRASLKNVLHLARWKIVEWQEMPDYNGCRVLAAPDSDSVDPVPEIDDEAHLYSYMAAWYEAVLRVEKRVRSAPKIERYVMWGAGAHTEFLYQTTSLFAPSLHRLYVLVDSDRLKHGRSWRGIQIYSPDILKYVDWSSTVLIASSYGGQESIIKAAREQGVPDNRVVRLYEKVSVY